MCLSSCLPQSLDTYLDRQVSVCCPLVFLQQIAQLVPQFDQSLTSGQTQSHSTVPLSNREDTAVRPQLGSTRD